MLTTMLSLSTREDLHLDELQTTILTYWRSYLQGKGGNGGGQASKANANASGASGDKDKPATDTGTLTAKQAKAKARWQEIRQKKKDKKAAAKAANSGTTPSTTPKASTANKDDNNLPRCQICDNDSRHYFKDCPLIQKAKGMHNPGGGSKLTKAKVQFANVTKSMETADIGDSDCSGGSL